MKIVFSLLFFLISFFSFSQTSELRMLIKTSTEIAEKQKLIDDFFGKEKDMPKDSLADCYHDVALRWYFQKRWKKTGNHAFLEQAINNTKQAIQLKQSAIEIDSLSLQKSLYNLGYFYRNGDQVFEAIAAFSKLLEMPIINRKTYIAYRHLSECYIEIGDYYKALHFIEKGIQLNKSDTKQRDKLALAYYSLAECYAKLGPTTYSNEILENLNTADSISRLSEAPIEIKNTLGNMINHLNGNRLVEVGDYDAAITVFQNAIPGFDPLDSMRLTVIHNSLGYALLHNGQAEEAFKQLNKALEYNSNYSPAYENLGDYYWDKKEFKKAMPAYQLAILKSIGKKENLHFDELPPLEELKLAVNKNNLLSHLIQKALGWQSYYAAENNVEYLKKALFTFQLADAIIDELRLLSLEDQTKLFWLEKGADLYMNAVAVCYALKKPEMAYYFMEKNKALLLLGTLANEKAKQKENLPTAIANREFLLKKNIHLLENKLEQNRGGETSAINLIKDEIYIAKNDFEKFIDSLKIHFPAYSKTREKIELLPYDQLADTYVIKEAVVLQYILNEDQGFGLLHTTEAPIFFQLKDEELANKILELNKKLSAPIFNTMELQYLRTISNDVFQSLFPDNIASHIFDKKLLIIPDYILQQLPFEALITDSNSGKYLLETTEIFYAYSMAYLDLNKRIQRTPENEFIGFAPVTYPNLNLEQLNYSSAEAGAIENIITGNFLQNEKATTENFLTRVADFQIIHLSTHADAGNDINPWIAFHDDKIYLDEIYATKNQAELVVLSGCNTSIGTLKKGEGAMSLARGFFHAGTNAVLSSLWPANDKANKVLMVDFYKGLDEGLSKSSALRQSKLNYLKAHSGSELSPFYWAATILIGDEKGINISAGWSFWNWSLLVFLLGIILFFTIKKK